MTHALLIAFRRRLHRLWRNEDGTATIEFTFVIPLVVTLFMASVESGVYMIRYVMMDRGLDVVMRDFRLGRLQSLSHDEIRDLVCEAVPVISNCQSELKVWIEPIDTTTWEEPGQTAYCGDGNGSLNAQNTGSVVHGSQNQLMFVRICVVQDPLFPTTGLGLKLRADSVTGGYQIATSTVVVNEPTVSGGAGT